MQVHPNEGVAKPNRSDIRIPIQVEKSRKASGLGFHILGEKRKRGFRGEVEKIGDETNILSCCA